MDLQHIINCLSALHLNIDKKNEASFEIEEILKMLIQYKKEQALQLQQTGVIRSSVNYCRSCGSKNISIDVSCEPNELICDDCWSLNISTEK